MGADIHLFAELNSRDTYHAVSDGSFLLPPNYDLFSALAGVRAPEGFRPVVPPRGFPPNASVEVASRYYMPVLEEETAVRFRYGDFVTLDEAHEWVGTGASSWWHS
ncbi:MAG: hypothetical protein AAFX94_25750, partial [Myxococcota bacterium]